MPTSSEDSIFPKEVLFSCENQDPEFAGSEHDHQKWLFHDFKIWDLCQLKIKILKWLSTQGRNWNDYQLWVEILKLLSILVWNWNDYQH